MAARGHGRGGAAASRRWVPKEAMEPRTASELLSLHKVSVPDLQCMAKLLSVDAAYEHGGKQQLVERVVAALLKMKDASVAVVHERKGACGAPTATERLAMRAADAGEDDPRGVAMVASAGASDNSEERGGDEKGDSGGDDGDREREDGEGASEPSSDDEQDTYTITIRKWDGTTRPCYVSPGDTVGKVKSYIKGLLGMPKAEQRLLVGGQDVGDDDGKAAVVANIKEGCTVDVVSRGRGGGKRGRQEAPVAAREGALKKQEKLAIYKMKAETNAAKEVQLEETQEIMAMARALLNDGPANAAALFQNLSMDDIEAIESFESQCAEKSGPAFYTLLLPFFVPQVKEMQLRAKHLEAALSAISSAWLFRVSMLLMTANGKLEREALETCLEARKLDIRKGQEEEEKKRAATAEAERQAVGALTNPQILQNMMQNQEVMQAMLANPAMQALIAAMAQQVAGQRNENLG